ncbi:TPA: FISUMP domain-containing protein [Elizabethkingia anophelis]
MRITNLLFLSILILYSCRSTNAEDVLLENKDSEVRFNLLGSDFSAELADLEATSKQELSNYLPTSSIKLIEPSTLVSVNSVPTTSGLINSANTGSSPKVVTGGALDIGTRFRVISYNVSDGKYHNHQDYIVGNTGKPMKLIIGKEYHIVVYSFGSKSVLPDISAEEKSLFNTAVVKYDNTKPDFMFKSFTFTPNNQTMSFDITLRHKLAQLTVTVNSSGIGNISSLQVTVTPHYTDGSFLFPTGTISGNISSNLTLANVLFPSAIFPGTIFKSSPFLLNSNTYGSKNGSVYLFLNLNGVEKLVEVKNSFIVKPESRTNINVIFSKCGAFVAPGIWKNFMCHNLGVTDLTSDPFVPSAKIHGAKYQWGYKPSNINTSDGKYYTQIDDQRNGGVISNWSQLLIANGLWVDNVKTIQDPCPIGYRVPSKDEWNGVINNNNSNYIGKSWIDSPTNYFTGIKFGDKLFLPAAGYRNANNGTLNNRGYAGAYWSSTEGTFAAGIGSMGLGFGTPSLITYIVGVNRLSGFSVRCIQE